jgi:hypothetical protein
MLTLILLTFLIILLLLLAIVFFAPVTVSCSGSLTEAGPAAEILGWWLHPNVLKCVVDIKQKAFSVVAFGKFRIFSSGAGELPEEKVPAAPPEDVSVEGKPEPLPEPQQQQQQRPSFSAEEPPHYSTAEQSEAEKHEETSEQQDHVDAEGSIEEEKVPYSEKMIPMKKAWLFIKDSFFRGKVLRWLKRFLLALPRILKVNCCSIRLKSGFSDPAITGAVYGYYIGLKNMISSEKQPRSEMLFEPVFNDEPFTAEARIEISTSIARLCLPVVFAVLTFPYLHAYLLYRRSKKIGKK